MTNGTGPQQSPNPPRVAPAWEPYSPGPPPSPAPPASASAMPPPVPGTGVHAQQGVIAPPPIPGTGLNAQLHAPQAIYLRPQTIYVPARPEKSLALAYLLWFLFGILGVHQFYLGKVGRGVSYVFTAAWLTVGWWIDLFTLPRQVRQVNELQDLR